MRTFSVAVQEPGSHQICQKAMYGTDRQPRKRRHLLCSEAPRRLAEKVQKPQPTLQGRYVVISFRTNSHRNSKNESAGLSDENRFFATRVPTGGQISSLPAQWTLAARSPDTSHAPCSPSAAPA